MNIKQLIRNENKSGFTGLSGFFSAYGSFGIVDGKDTDIKNIAETENGFRFENQSFFAECALAEYENGVFSRRDSFTAKQNLIINRYTSRFCLEGGDYEVYTQFSGWQTESLGGWQDLVTGIELSNMGVRMTEGAAPMAAIRNKGNGKILVLHLMPNANWKISMKKVPLSGKNMVLLIETGINDKGLDLKVSDGETIEMPQILMYEADSAIDFDAWKLHTVYNRMYPRRQLPVMYNTWLNTFDTIDVNDIINQAKSAAELGVEYFVIDAGWFGYTENWDHEIGNWNENHQSGFQGRVHELSDYVRKLGMKFGMWLEPERALKSTEAYKRHPQYYKNGSNGNAFLDFSNAQARKYITDITLGLIEKYRLEFMKFDFNASLAYDETGEGFYRYLKGVRQFLASIKSKHPDLYLTNCASGGNRMDLENGIYYDSIWSSDNQSPISGLKIFKDTALRMPPCHIEKWDVRRFFDGFPQYGKKELTSLPISCNGATWENICNVKRAYTNAFLTGGPIGFSTNIADYPDEEKEILKSHIKQFKEEREFYRTANMRILHDTDELTAIEYADCELKKIKVQVFSNITKQSFITVYPILKTASYYSYHDDVVQGNRLFENGIKVKVSDINCEVVDIVEAK